MFEQLIQNKLVRETNFDELRMIKFSRLTFKKKLWNESALLLLARGLVLDSDDNIVALPFTKVFNFNENNAGQFLKNSPNTLVQTAYKANGFMLSISLYKGELLYSSTGSLTSPHVKLGESMISDSDKGVIKSLLETELKDHTMSFEICTSIGDDPHPIDEGEKVYFLSYRKNTFDTTYFGATPKEANEFYHKHLKDKTDLYECKYKEIIFSDLIKELETCTTEGVMVYNPYNNETFKIKSAYYLCVKFFMRISDKKITNLFENPAVFKDTMNDEEFYWIVDLIYQNPQYKDMDQDERRKFIIDNFNRYLGA